MSFYLQTNVGFLDPVNKYCIDWNSSGSFAYANHYTINIVDASSMKIIQTLENSKVSISRLKWSEANIYDNQLMKPIFKLAAADEHGMISIWNTFESKLINELIDSSNSISSGSKVISLNWKLLSNKKEVIMSLYSGNKLIVWDPQFGIKLWSKAFTANIFHMAIDPHQYGRVAFIENNFVELILQCFDVETTTSGTKVEKNSIRVPLFNELHHHESRETRASSTESDKKNSFVILNRYFKGDTSDNNLKSSVQTSNQPIQVEFHSIYKNILLILYPREIIFFDLFISQTIGQIQLEKNQSAFSQIHSSSQKDVLFVLHENGCITVRSKESTQNNEIFGSQSEPIGNAFRKLEFNFSYPICAQSDNIRLSKNAKVFGFTVCPTTQKSIALLINDGRVLKYELLKKFVFTKKTDVIKYKKAPEDIFLFDLFKRQDNESLKIILTKMINPSAAKLYISKMCPPLTKRNSKYWEPILAIGCPTGNLAIYNIIKNCTEKKITTLNNSMIINGIEWISYFTIITWSYYSSQFNLESSFGPITEANHQLVRNDIFLTDLRTGETRKFRESQKEESPIIQIKLSNSKQYLVILFKEQPFEIWDIKTFSLIKKISKKSPTIKILEWCSVDFKKCDPKHDKDSETASESLVKCQSEHFICIDNNDLMYSFSVENNIIKDGGKVLPEDGLLAHITAVAIKKDLIVFADMDGNLSVWNIRLKSSKVIPNKQNSVRKIKFAPGKENFLLLVLYAELIRVYEIKSGDLISTFKTQNNKTQEILDCDWCASDKLTISFSNGCISMFDIFFKRSIDERKYLLSISSHKVLQPINEFSRIIYLAKRFYFQVVDVLLEESDFTDFKNLANLINQYSNNNQNLSDFLNATSLKLRDFFLSISANASGIQKSKSMMNKTSTFARISLYLNMCKFEIQFWTYLAYLFAEKQQEKDQNESGDIFYDMVKQNEYLLKTRDFRQRQYEFCKLYKEKNVVSNAVVQRDLLLCNEQNLVFNLLTETDDLNNAYKACLISSLQNTKIHPDSQTNIKLVATNLIINGKIEEGIELLCLIGLTFDACRYLQDNSNWEKAAWLAKLRLPEIEYIEIMKRWVDYLCSAQHSTNNLEFAILILVSCKQYSRALELLSGSVYAELGYFFLELCLENQLVTVCEHLTPEIEEMNDEKSKASVFRYSGKNSTVITSMLETKIKENYKKLQVF